MSNETQRYLVVSYNDDQEEWFYDTVLAESHEQAVNFICAVRPYVIGADASLGAEFAANLKLEINGTEWDARESISECQSCGSCYPESHLNPIQDLNQRVEAGEPMPSGECPDCGALCQLREPSK